MSFSILKSISDAQKRKNVVDVRSGDTIKVTQRIEENGKSRLQTFEGTVIRVTAKNSSTARIVVRKVTSGVGVEKSYLLYSPLIEKIEIVKRSKVRRNNLTYLRQRSGKSARLKGKDFDRAVVNTVAELKESAIDSAEASVEKESSEPVASENSAKTTENAEKSAVSAKTEEISANEEPSK